MPITEKCLWAVGYSSLADFVARSVATGMTSVAIRTDNDLPAAIAAFKGHDIAVYGWRWPSAQRAAAMQEANNVARLLGKGLAGYIVDPEGAPGESYDWDQDGLAGLASDFCQAIATAAAGKPFGVTSHYKAKDVFPRLPWAAFFANATVLLPQAYWRVAGGQVGSGQPAENYTTSIAQWHAAGADLAKIVPMAGELAHVKAADVTTYVQTAQAQGRSALHFYTYEDGIQQAVWDAIAAAPVVA
jgi:hypothetical protein